MAISTETSTPGRVNQRNVALSCCLEWAKVLQQSPFSFQLRFRNGSIADAHLAEEHHAQTVNADADTAAGMPYSSATRKSSRRLLLLASGLGTLQRGALHDGIVLLGVAGEISWPLIRHS